MSELLQATWLVEQSVPLLWFIIALLTRPATWSKRATKLFREQFDSEK